MIQTLLAALSILNWVIDEALAIYSEPFPNEDGSAPTSVIDDFKRWMKEDRGAGGPTPSPLLIQYTVEAVLVAHHVLVRTKRKASVANQLNVIVHELSDQQLAKVGMDPLVVRSATAAIVDALIKDRTFTNDGERIEAVNQRLYERYADFASRMYATVDPSPFPKGLKLSVAERKAIRSCDLTPEKAKGRAAKRRELMRTENHKRLAAIGSNSRRLKRTHAQRQQAAGRNVGLLYDTLPRISKSTQRRNRQRLDLAMNKIVAGSIK